MKPKIKSFIQGSLVVVVSILVISTIVKAGTITPPSETPVTAKFYTLSEIYTRLTTNATATEGGHDFTFSDNLASTHYTLTQIYDAIPTIVANTVKSGTTYLGVTGTLVPDGTATATDCLDTKTFYSGDSWTKKTGSITTQTLSDANETVSAGYYNATTLSAVDTDLAAGNIAADIDIFGVSGTLLKNLFNGSAGANVADSAFYTQAKGGVDDYNNNGTMPADSYTSTWTICNSGNNYCETGDATNADKKDDSTGLVWSIWLDSGTTHTWFWANNCYEPGTTENPGDCAANGDDACQCVKKTSAGVGCEALGDGGWRLPHQKELMQAYIDGSWGNLSSASNYYWSATTLSNYTPYAWYTRLGLGYTGSTTKTAAVVMVRCVRQLWQQFNFNFNFNFNFGFTEFLYRWLHSPERLWSLGAEIPLPPLIKWGSQIGSTGLSPLWSQRLNFFRNNQSSSQTK